MNSPSRQSEQGFSSKIIHAKHPAVGDPLGGVAINTSSYRLELNGQGVVEPRDADYGRVGNPTFTDVERKISLAAGASHTTVFASGISAISATLLSLKSGDVILAEENSYGCTIRVEQKVLADKGIKTVYADLANPENYHLIGEIKPKIVMIESPTNPLLKILDIEAIAEHCRKVGATLAVDNSFASAFSQQPLALGATLSVESLTKYANGHSSGMLGAVSTNDPEWAHKLDFMRKAVGFNPGVQECFMTNFFLDTLELRMQRHSENASAAADFLMSHPLVEGVRFPFSSNHPQYTLARKQMRTAGGILAVDFKLSLDETVRLLNDLDPMFTVAHSIGSTKSQVSLPAFMSHSSVPREQRIAAGITDGLVRFSFGIENSADIIAALSDALANRVN